MAVFLRQLAKPAFLAGAAALGFQQTQINQLKSQNADLSKKVDTLAHNAFVATRTNTILASAALQDSGRDVQLYGDSAITIDKGSYHPQPGMEDMTSLKHPTTNLFMLQGHFPGIKDSH